MANSQFVLYKTDGTVVTLDIGSSDVARGASLTTILNQAAADSGSTVVVPPAEYKTANITRDGVTVELMEGAILYTDSTFQGANLVNVTSGRHVIAGFGTLESRTSATTGHAISHTGGDLICTVQKITSAASQKATVISNASGGTSLISLDAHFVESDNDVALEINGDADCLIRVRKLTSLGGSTTDHALSIGGGDANSSRDIYVQRAQSTNGEAIHVGSSGRVTVHCDAAHSSGGYAASIDNPLQETTIGFAESTGAKPTVKLDEGLLAVNQLEHRGSSHVIDMAYNTLLSASAVINRSTTAGSDGIRLTGTQPDTPLVDVGEIQLAESGGNAILGDGSTPQKAVRLIRDYRSTKSMNGIVVIPSNHP